MARAAPAAMDSQSEDELSTARPRVKSKENRDPSIETLAISSKRAGKGKAASPQDTEEEDMEDSPTAKPSKSAAKTKPTAKPKRTKKSSVEPMETEEADDNAAALEELVEETQDNEPTATNKKKPLGVSSASKTGKDASTSAREKRLQAKLDLTTRTLEQVQASFAALRELRETRAEASERALSDLAAERQSASLVMVQNYKAENDALRAELALAKKGIVQQPEAVEAPAAPEVPTEEGIDSKAEISRLEKELERREKEERRKLKERDADWKREIAKNVKATVDHAAKEMDSLKADLATAEQELAAEVSHSKSLQAKLKALPPGSSSSNLLANTSLPSSSANQAAHQKLQEEFDLLTSRLNLNEDLTGLAIVNVKLGEEVPIYNCMLSDCLGKAGSLNFKLKFLLDGSATYEPDILAERDPVMFELLPPQLRTLMRFDAEDSGKWFRSLFKAVNKLS